MSLRRMNGYRVMTAIVTAALCLSSMWTIEYAANLNEETAPISESTESALPEPAEFPEDAASESVETVLASSEAELVLPEDVMSLVGNYGPDIQAETYCVIDGNTGDVILAKNKDARMYPASCTKILTALIVCEQVPDLSAKLTFTQTAVNVDPSSSTLDPKAMAGEVMSVRDVLYGMLLKSGNECGAMLGEYVAGSEAAFAEMMNKRAQEIGCVNSHFTNAYGIHNDDHYTTAYDLALILQEAMKNETYRKLNATVTYQIPATNMWGQPRDIVMGHAMLNGTVPERGVIGGKTGSTPQAQKVLATACDRDGFYTISTLMHTTKESWYPDEQVLLDYTYELLEHQIGPIEWVETGDRVTPTNNLRVRYSPSIKSYPLGYLEVGTETTRLGIYNEWSKILYNGEIHYVASEFLTSLEPEKVPETEAYVYETEPEPETETETPVSGESVESETQASETGHASEEQESASELPEKKGDSFFGRLLAFLKSIPREQLLKYILVGVLSLIVIVMLIIIITSQVKRKLRKRRRNRMMSRRRKRNQY